MPRFAVAAVFQDAAQRLSHELYIVRARTDVHAEGFALQDAARDSRRLVSLLVTPAMTEEVVHG